MKLTNKVNLGEINFHGEVGTLFREIYSNGDWKLVIMLNDKRIVMITY